MTANIIVIALSFILASYLMIIQEIAHRKAREVERDKIGSLQDAILSKQRDYVAAKETIQNLEAVREQLEKDLATAQKLGNDWLKDLEKEQLKSRGLQSTVNERGEMLRGNAERISELERSVQDIFNIKLEYERLNRKLERENSDMKSRDEVARQQLETLKKKLKEKETQLSERHSKQLDELLEKNKELASREEDAKDLQLKLAAQGFEIARLSQENGTYRGKIKKYVDLLSREGRERRQMVLDLEILKAAADREEEKRSKLFAFSQSYLRRLMLPEYRVKEYCHLAEEHLKEPEDVLDSLLAPVQLNVESGRLASSQLKVESGELKKTPQLSTDNSQLSTDNSKLSIGGEDEMSTLPKLRHPGIAHDQASASEPDHPDADLPEMPF